MMISFPRYLAAKKTVDDRALNKDVWAAMAATLPPSPRILEVGAGIGTMVERFADHGLLDGADYTAVDNQPENIATAQKRLAHLHFPLHLHAADLFDFLPRAPHRYDLLIAHAFLDLMDIPAALPRLFAALKPGGRFYFTLNFDGATILEPALDPEFDALVERLYHQTMDERVTGGEQSGDSRSGRHLFRHIRQAGGHILTAGSSDWVVFAQANDNSPDGQYPADEAYFLGCILHFFRESLAGHPALDAARFADWLAQRQTQIEAGELVYIAHQIDFFGKLPVTGKQ